MARSLKPCAWACAAALSIAAAPARADCGVLPFSVTQPLVDGFLFGRMPLLANNPNGGESLARVVGVIAMSSKAALPRLLQQARMANAQQKLSIAEGLGFAAQRCQRPAPAEARNIERSVLALREPAMQLAFTKRYRSEITLQAEGNAASATEALQRLYQPPQPPPARILPLPSDAIGPIEPITPVQPVTPRLR